MSLTPIPLDQSEVFQRLRQDFAEEIGRVEAYGIFETIDDLKTAPADVHGRYTLTTPIGRVEYSYIVGNFVGRADDVLIVKLTDVSLSTGALVRQGNFTVVLDQFYQNGDNGDYGPAFSRMVSFCHITRATGQFDVKRYLIKSIQNVNGKTFKIVGLPGHELHFEGVGKLEIDSCHGSQLSDWNITGTMADDQFSVFKTGVTSAFSSLSFYKRTLGDTTFTGNDGSGWKHELSGNLLKVSPLTQAAGFIYVVESDFIPLNPTKRFVIDVLPGWLTGEQGITATFLVYDASNNLLGEYNPHAHTDSAFASSWWSLIKGGAKLKIRLGAQRHFRTPANLEAVYDLSKIVIYQLENDFATLNLSTNSPGDGTQLQISNSRNIRVPNLRASNMANSAIVLVACQGCSVDNPYIRRCQQGVNDTNGVDNTITNVDIDLRFGVIGGGLMGNRAYRMRCVGGSGCRGLNIRDGSMIGASWAVEILPRLNDARVNISGLKIDAEQVAISIDGVGVNGYAEVSNIDAVLSVTGQMGFEAAGGPTGWRGQFKNCSVRWADLCWQGVGVAASTNCVFEFIGGSIEAPVALAATDRGSVVFEPTSVTHCHSIAYTTGFSIEARNILAKRKRTLAIYGDQAETSFHAERAGLNFYMIFSVTGCKFSPGYNCDYEAFGYDALTIERNRVVGDGTGRNILSFLSANSSSASVASIKQNEVTNSPNSGPWVYQGDLFTGSNVESRGNRINGQTVDFCVGVHPSKQFGLQGMVGYAVNWSPGLLDAKSSIETPIAVMNGAGINDYIRVKGFGGLQLPAGLMLINPRVVGENQVRATLFNARSDAIDPGTFSVEFMGEKT